VRQLALLLALAAPAAAQLTRQNIASILGFENNTRAGVFPASWGGAPTNTIFTDDQVVHSGKYSARLERTSSSANDFSTVTTAIPLDFAGKVIQWRGWLKTENVDGFAALWLREDGDSPNVAFATLQSLNLNGRRDWTQYTISVNSAAEGKQLVFGFLLSGTGKAWVDDLELLVDGVPVSQAAARVPTVFDVDHEFDAGSRVSLTSLTDLQISNLATLAKVWGFLKYHHPAITTGTHHWDYDLFRVLPKILAATDNSGANQAMSDWIAGIGAVPDCNPCATLDTTNLYLKPDFDWISDESLLGSDLSQTLRNIYRNRSAAAAQFFVSIHANPSFDNELFYGNVRFPDAGYQVLALFRYWNMVQYFYPNRDIMSDDPANQPNYWNDVLTEFIPAIALAADTTAYQLQLMRFIGRIHDTHANLWSSLGVRPPIGACILPVDLSFVEGKPVVLHYDSPAGPSSGLMPGDIIEQHGVAVNELIEQWRPYYADSNEAARLRDIAISMTHGNCGPASVAVRRDGSDDLVTLTPSRVPLSTIDAHSSNHDLPGDTFRLVNSDIAYLKLSSVRAADSASYIQAAAGTKGLIIDIRNYPSEFVVFTLGQLLVSQQTNFVTFTHADLSNPGAIQWWQTVYLTPQEPHYNGKVVILVDEITQSQAEYTTMAFRTAPGAVVVGSTTAGADGDVSTIPLPGGLSSYISGLGVFYPDKRPTQRIGIIPDILVKPTIAGIRAGRDELFEEAVRQILGSANPVQ
jgi:C-terminal processing protease CtpA/Prc